MSFEPEISLASADAVGVGSADRAATDDDQHSMPRKDSLIILKNSSYSLKSEDKSTEINSAPDLTSTISIIDPPRKVRFSDGAGPVSPIPVLRRSILKSTLSPAEIEEIQRQKEKHRVMMEQMKAGSLMWKYSSESKCEKRMFSISKDETELIWRHCGKITSLKQNKVPFAAVKNIVFGPRTPGFKSFDWKRGKSWLCFSIICENRNVDIECPDLETFTLWYFGIQQLAPLSHKFLTQCQVNWRRALFKTAQLSLVCEMPLEDVWHELVRMARSPVITEPNSAVMKDKLLEYQTHEVSAIHLHQHHHEVKGD
eukprot:TRINITY_DN5162_c0_g1_i1.p1 TRINITY_DN5162_c0_g1~~TRINITY_DN5162_c0_g1_i1.p1  ORF type:complete len:312 (-),score=51.39 TRINITY_DN5162_c0_g1_i1:217-1152(-)